MVMSSSWRRYFYDSTTLGTRAKYTKCCGRSKIIRVIYLALETLWIVCTNNASRSFEFYSNLYIKKSSEKFAAYAIINEIYLRRMEEKSWRKKGS